MSTSPARLAQWLQRVPPAADRLELRYDAISGPQVLTTFLRAELENLATGQLAESLIESAQDQAEASRARISLSVVWLDAAGRVLATKPLREEPANDNGELAPLKGAGEPPKEPASTDGIVAQLMRHVENRERMLNLALGTNLKLMHDQLREARNEADQLRVELRLARQRVKEVEDGGGGETIEGEARAEAVMKVTDAVVHELVPLLAARLREGMQ